MLCKSRSPLFLLLIGYKSGHTQQALLLLPHLRPLTFRTQSSTSFTLSYLHHNTLLIQPPNIPRHFIVSSIYIFLLGSSLFHRCTAAGTAQHNIPQLKLIHYTFTIEQRIDIKTTSRSFTMPINWQDPAVKDQLLAAILASFDNKVSFHYFHFTSKCARICHKYNAFI